MPDNLLQFIVTLGVLVIAHELGHFVTAKRSGVTVHEFGIGFPPRLFAIRRGGTDYSVNLVPLGGFVRMVGEEDPSQPGSLAGKSIPTRALVLAAGPLMNGVLAVVLFTAAYMIPRETIVGQVAINAVAPGSPAERAGLQPGDVIQRVNGRRVQHLGDVGYHIQLALGGDVEMQIRRDRYSVLNLTMTPRWDPPPGQGPTGIQIGMLNRYKTQVAYPIWEAVPIGWQKTVDSLVAMKNLPAMIMATSKVPEVAGPIGIYQLTNEAAKGGYSYLIEFTAFLSLNLAIFNLLPVPMLDGGRLVFVALEAIRRKRVPPEKEGLVHLVGMALLLTLIVVVSYHDIQRLINNESLFR